MWRIKYWIQEENFLSSSAMKIRIFLFFVGWTNPRVWSEVGDIRTSFEKVFCFIEHS